MDINGDRKKMKKRGENSCGKKIERDEEKGDADG